jgi:hypothetical protein
VWIAAVLFLAAAAAEAQTAAEAQPAAETPAAETPAAETPVAVVSFAGDDVTLSGRVRTFTITQMENQERFIPRPLNVAPNRPDESPDPGLLEGAPYVLTGEYYFDDEDMHHCQLWLWNSDDGSLVYTDELVAENVEEAEGYLPHLVAWVLSKVPETGETEETVETVEEKPAGAPEASGTVVKWEFPRLLLGLRGGAALDFQSTRVAGDYDGERSQGFGGEAALTVEFRPGRYLSFQAEGIFAMEIFTTYRVDTTKGLHTGDRYRGMYLMFPLLFKVAFGGSGLRPAVLGGAYYILPLRKTLDGAVYRDTVDLPLGVTAGFEVGYPLGGGRFGEIYGSLRAGYDLGLIGVEETGLRYTRGRVVFSAGWRFNVLKRKDPEPGPRNGE